MLNVLKKYNMSNIPEDEYILLSGIQHFAFCKRQWALIHVEQQWADNLRTTDGQLVHERVHERISEKRKNVLEIRGLAVRSSELGVVGSCDMVEFHASDKGVPIFGRSGTWLPVPIEYKRGHPKPDDRDALQLCAQAICLEEMMVCQIPNAYLYYAETKRREPVFLSDELRTNVVEMFMEMHMLFRKGYTPLVKPSKSCQACSLREICLPKLANNTSVASYINSHVNEADQ